MLCHHFNNGILPLIRVMILDIDHDDPMSWSFVIGVKVKLGSFVVNQRKFPNELVYNGSEINLGIQLGG